MDFERLEVWQRGKALSVAMYRALAECPDYGFRNQLTRAALSIPSNIAEGMERGGNAEKLLDFLFGFVVVPFAKMGVANHSIFIN